MIIFLFLLPFSNLGKFWDRWRRLSSRDGATGGGTAEGGTSRGSQAGRRQGAAGSDSIIDGQAVRLDPEEPPPG
jgi:hypothetical protein